MSKNKKQQEVDENVAEQEAVEQEVQEQEAEEVVENEATEQEPDNELEQLQAELEKKTQEAADYKDKWIRSVADVENLRKRFKNEKEDLLKYGNTNIITDLLVILDDFERAIEAGKTDNFDKDAYISGVEMIEKQFDDLLFKKYGVEKYGEVGDDFNPNDHQAMMMTEGDYEKEVLANVFRKGYKLHDRVIRPAQVQVGKPASK